MATLACRRSTLWTNSYANDNKWYLWGKIKWSVLILQLNVPPVSLIQNSHASCYKWAPIVSYEEKKYSFWEIEPLSKSCQCWLVRMSNKQPLKLLFGFSWESPARNWKSIVTQSFLSDPLEDGECQPLTRKLVVIEILEICQLAWGRGEGETVIF